MNNKNYSLFSSNATEAGDCVELLGTGSDRDGEIVSYQWLQKDGMAVSLINASIVAPEVSSQAKLQFLVTKNIGDISVAEVNIVVSSSPKNNKSISGNVGVGGISPVFLLLFFIMFISACRCMNNKLEK